LFLPPGSPKFSQGSQGLFVAFTKDFLAQLAVKFFQPGFVLPLKVRQDFRMVR